MSTPRALRLNSEDNVVIAVDEIRPGDVPAAAPPASERIPRGHKMASVAIAAGAPGAQVRPDHRLRLEADRCRGSGCTSTIA